MKNTQLQLEDLKVSNLPELSGWKEKQEKLVEENPYVEVVDNKAYEIACKSRTALLKGRTELEKQDKLVASKLAAFRKDVKSETDALIAITLPHEEKQQSEVKRYEGIKEAEKAERDRIENDRIEKIKAKIEEIESSCYTAIQKAVFSNHEFVGTQLFSFFTIDFDFEEFDILYEQAKNRIDSQWGLKLAEINEREEQRLENERLAAEALEAQEKAYLQASRLTEMLPYVGYGGNLDLIKLNELDESAYAEELNARQLWFAEELKNKAEIQAKIDAENLEKANAEIENNKKVFEIRKNRLAEIGFRFLESQDRFVYDDKNISILKTISTIYDCDELLFEEIIAESKDDIEKAKEDAKVALFESRKNTLISIGYVYDESQEYAFFLSEDWKCTKGIVEGIHELGWEEFVNDAIAYQKHIDEELSKADAIKLKAENKARVKKYANDKKVLKEFILSLEFRNAVPELENEDMQVALDGMLEILTEVKEDLQKTLNKF